jgi:adenosylmethionine-8-amino-7-oxononanoate aminotransferase
MGAHLEDELHAALDGLPAVGDVRGVGMLWAVEFVADRQSREPLPAEVHFADRVCARCMQMGVLLYPGHGSADGRRGDHLMVAPPFVVTEGEVAIILDVLRRAILDVSKGATL